jgi:hypothetical protein
MKTKQFFLKVANLFLMADERTADWVQIPILRRAWYCFFFCILLIVFAQILLLSLPIETSSTATLIYRCISLIFIAIMSATLVVMTYCYLRHVVSKNYPVKLGIVIRFWIYHLFLWGMMYFRIYHISPSAFHYENPILEYSSTVVKSLSNYVTLFHFLLYSAFQSLNANFYRIGPRSVFPSILGWIQSLYTLSLVALLIASYVNQKSYPHTGEKGGNNAEQNTPLDGE